MIKTSENYIFEIIGRPILGIGTTAVVFLTKNNEVFKIYLDTERKHYLFQEYNMKEHLLELSNIDIKHIYTPKDIYMKDETVIGIKLDYIKGNTLKKKIPDIKLKEFSNMLEVLIEETNKLSELGVFVRDFHSKNVIINSDGINIFDTDQFDITIFSKDWCLEHNLNAFIHEILYTIFKFPNGFDFQSKCLSALLTKFFYPIGTSEDDLKLYYALCEELGGDTSIRDVNRLVKTLGKVNF